MLTAINQWAFPAGMPAVAALDQAKAYGFGGFEVCVGLDGPVRLDACEQEFGAIRRHAESIGMHLTSVGCALGFEYPLSSGDAAVVDRAVALQEQALQAAAWLGVETLLLVPGIVSPDIAYDAALANARKNVGRLVPVAERLGVSIGVENVWNKFLLSPLEMRDFVDSFGSAHVGAFMDTGNIVLYGFAEQWIRILGSRIRMVHAKDFRASAGNFDGFVMLLEGDVNWPGVMAALREAGYDKALVAEYGPYRHAPETLLRQVHAGLEAIVAMPQGAPEERRQ